MEEWKLIKIGNLCKRVCSGGTPKSTVEEYYGGGIPWLNTKEVNFNRIYSTESTISEAGLNNSSAKWIDKHSVIVAMYGATAAKCAIGMIPMTTNQACCNLMIDEDIADYRFVYYALTNSYSILASFANGGAQQNLNAQLIKDFEILLPDLHTQHRIADILSTIDDKIENNNRINHNLEEQADCLISSAIETQSIGSAHLWDICSYVTERVNNDTLNNKNYISTDNMFANKGGIGIASTIPDGKCTSFKVRDVLVSNIRPYFKKIWRASFSGGCSNDVLCFRTTKGTSSFLYHLLRSDVFFDYVMSGAKGSKMPRGDKQHIMNWTIPVFEKAIITSLEDSLEVIDDRVAIIQEENRRLSAIRDSLLPMLMTNSIYINDLTC